MGRTLRIDVTGGDLSAGLRAMVVRRVRLAMGRFGGRVQKVTVRMAEPANPLGGLDQRCRMRAWLQAAGGVRAEAINGKMEVAVAVPPPDSRPAWPGLSTAAPIRRADRLE